MVRHPVAITCTVSTRPVADAPLAALQSLKTAVMRGGSTPNARKWFASVNTVNASQIPTNHHKQMYLFRVTISAGGSDRARTLRPYYSFERGLSSMSAEAEPASPGRNHWPPSTTRLTPVTYEAASLHKNKAASPISRLVPRRWMGMEFSTHFSRNSAGMNPPGHSRVVHGTEHT